MKNKGFTLVEILVVIVIIGALVAIVLPNTLSAIYSGNCKACASNLRSIDTALQMCYADQKNWASCNTVSLLVSGKYLEYTPTCPVNSATLYALTTDATTGAISATKTGHFASWPSIQTHTP